MEEVCFLECHTRRVSWMNLASITMPFLVKLNINITYVRRSLAMQRLTHNAL